MQHETEIKIKPFPFLTETLKLLREQLNEAEWINDIERMKKLSQKISTIEHSIKLGEVYDIPF